MLGLTSDPKAVVPTYGINKNTHAYLLLAPRIMITVNRITAVTAGNNQRLNLETANRGVGGVSDRQI